MYKREPKVPTVRLILILILLSGLFSAGLVHGASAAADDSTAANPTPTACSDPTTCASNVAAYTAIWKCIPAGSEACQSQDGADWWGSVISWPSWSAYQTNARTGANLREVVSAAGSLPLYPYMGSWADGCQVTALTDGVLIIEWQRGTETWEAFPLDTGESHTIDLVSPQDNAMIEGGIIDGAGVTDFRVSLSNCNPQPLSGPTFTPTHTATGTSTPTFTPTNTPTPLPTRRSNQTLVPTRLPRQSVAVLPVTLVTQSGSVNGSLSSLSLIEQTGSEDNPAAYIRFQTPGNTYMGYKSFALPANAQAHNISNLLVQVNFKGTASAQVWTWSIYDWMTGNWVIIGNSLGTQSNSWNTLLFPVYSITRYISPLGEVRVRLQSDNASDDAKIDYTALHITYDPVVPTPTPAIPTAIPTRPRYSFPATYTPTATP